MRPAEHDEFHEIVIGGSAGGLDDENIAATDVLIDLHMDFAVAEAVNGGVAKPGVKTGSNAAGKLRGRVPGKQLHISHKKILNGESFKVPAGHHEGVTKKVRQPRRPPYNALWR